MLPTRCSCGTAEEIRGARLEVLEPLPPAVDAADLQPARGPERDADDPIAEGGGVPVPVETGADRIEGDEGLDEAPVLEARELLRPPADRIELRRQRLARDDLPAPVGAVVADAEVPHEPLRRLVADHDMVHLEAGGEADQVELLRGRHEEILVGKALGPLVDAV